MTKQEFIFERHQISVGAGMNQRYHQSRAATWSWWDRGCKIVVGLLAVLGVCLCVVTANIHNYWWDGSSITTAALAALAAIALNVLPFGEWCSRHSALFERWTD